MQKKVLSEIAFNGDVDWDMTEINYQVIFYNQ